MQFGDSKTAVREVDAGPDPGGLLVLLKLPVDHVHEGIVLFIRDIDPKQAVDGLHPGAGTEDDEIGRAHV